MQPVAPLALAVGVLTASCHLISGLDEAVDAASTGGAGGTAAGSAGDAAVPTTDLVLWLRADKGIVHEQNAVTAWQDQSENGNHAVQGASDLQPTFAEMAWNGRPAVDFDGGDKLAIPAEIGDFAAGLSIFAALHAAPDNSGACRDILQFANGPELDDISLHRSDDCNGDCLRYEVEDQLFAASSVFPLDEALLFGVVHATSGLVVLYVGNTPVNSGDNIPLPAKPRSINFVASGLYATCVPYSGLIAELLVYSRAVTDEERAAVFTHLSQSWP